MTQAKKHTDPTALFTLVQTFLPLTAAYKQLETVRASISDRADSPPAIAQVPEVSIHGNYHETLKLLAVLP